MPRRRDMKEALKAVEWKGQRQVGDDIIVKCCPLCGGLHSISSFFPDEKAGHKDDCLMVYALYITRTTEEMEEVYGKKDK